MKKVGVEKYAELSKKNFNIQDTRRSERKSMLKCQNINTDIQNIKISARKCMLE